MAKEYTLEARSTEFAKAVIRICKQLPYNSMNERLIGQVVGSSGSIGANYREANDAIGKKDFVQRLKIARRESKECLHWLDLLSEANSEKQSEIQTLSKECDELKSILSSIIIKSE